MPLLSVRSEGKTYFLQTDMITVAAYEPRVLKIGLCHPAGPENPATYYGDVADAIAAKLADLSRKLPEPAFEPPSVPEVEVPVTSVNGRAHYDRCTVGQLRAMLVAVPDDEELLIDYPAGNPGSCRPPARIMTRTVIDEPGGPGATAIEVVGRDYFRYSRNGQDRNYLDERPKRKAVVICC